MHQCKSGNHWWTLKADAERCCNGYSRVLVFGGGENQQEAGGISIGRAWVRTDALIARGKPFPDPNCSNCDGKGGAEQDGSCGQCWDSLEYPGWKVCPECNGRSPRWVNKNCDRCANTGRVPRE